MRILITGATGFIGTHLVRRLAADGHHLIGAVRDAAAWRARLPCHDWLACDFTRDLSPTDWAPRLAGVDLVINAVGLIAEHGQQTFRQVQAEAPRALFTACSQAGIRVIQISALGADAPAPATAFLRSKRDADDFLWQLPGECVVVYPSIVIGRGGNSTALFCRLALLPVVPLPSHGHQRLNPVHIDDLCEAIAHVVRHWPGGKQRHWLTGTDTYQMRELLALLREWMQLPAAPMLPLPLSLLTTAARVAEVLQPRGLLRRDTLAMLQGVATPPPSLAAVPPRPLREALWSRAAEGPACRQQALAALLQPALLASLVLVWLVTGLVSLFWNRPAGYALLAGAGIHGALATGAIVAGGSADLALGLLLVSRRHRRLACLLQIGLMLAYLLIASVIVPATWLDPLGPLTKTLPLLAATAWLALDAPRARHPASPSC